MTTELDCSVGFSVAEASYATNTVVTKWAEFVDESFDWDPTFVQGVGLRVGSRVARSARRKLGKVAAKGDYTVEAVTKGIGFLFNAALGSSVSTVTTAPAYQQLHTVATSDYLPSFTIQKGIPPLGGGATLPHTFTGAVCQSMEMTAANGGSLQVKTSWNAKDVTTATAYAAPSYAAAPELFTFVDGSITIGGAVTVPTTTTLATGGTVAADITDWSLMWDNAIDGSGFTFGSSGRRGRKPAVGLAQGTGKITAEFDSVTLRDAYLAQTDLAMVLKFQSSVAITGAVFPTIQVVIPNIRLEGELPKSNGGDVVTQSIGYTVLDGLTAASPLYIAYITTDTTW